MIFELPADLEQFVHESVAKGNFATEAALLAEAVRLLQQREDLRREVQAGIDELDRGEGIPAEVVFGELGKRMAEREGS